MHGVHDRQNAVQTWWQVDFASSQVARRVGKRTFDLVVAAILSVVTFPIVLATALLSATVFRAWPFFVQQRVGRFGSMIPFIKVRTLAPNFDRYAVKSQWSGDQVPASMQWLRDYHLDEIPQLWLVVIGHLSLVGPRPKMPDPHEPVPEDYHTARTSVPQGCTCLWQIGEDQDVQPHQAPQYDYWYLRHGGLRLDLWILFWTAMQMVGLGSSKTIADVPRAFQSRGWTDLGLSEDPLGDLTVVPLHPAPATAPQRQRRSVA